jgi:hypothetical protein
MEEANSDFLDSDLLRDAEATNQRPALSPEGEEVTTSTVLPPPSPHPPPVAHVPPPLPARASHHSLPLPSFPPPDVAPMGVAPTGGVPGESAPAEVAPQNPMAPLPSFAFQAHVETPPPPPAASVAPPAPPAPPQPSWLRGLFRSTHPADAELARDAHAATVQRADVAGGLYAGFGLLFAVVSLVLALRDVPPEPGTAPEVVAALVLSRALFALGAGALAFALFVRAERMLLRGVPSPQKS